MNKFMIYNNMLNRDLFGGASTAANTKGVTLNPVFTTFAPPILPTGGGYISTYTTTPGIINASIPETAYEEGSLITGIITAIILAIILLAVGFIGFMFYKDHKKNDTAPTDSTDASTDTTDIPNKFNKSNKSNKSNDILKRRSDTY